MGKEVHTQKIDFLRFFHFALSYCDGSSLRDLQLSGVRGKGFCARPEHTFGRADSRTTGAAQWRAGMKYIPVQVYSEKTYPVRADCRRFRARTVIFIYGSCISGALSAILTSNGGHND